MLLKKRRRSSFINIGILTFTDGTNYGQRLQNLAVQHILEAYGHNVKTFIIRRPDTGIFNASKRIVKSLFHPVSNYEECLRQKKFDFFNHKYIKFYKKKIYSGMDSTDIESEFDLVVAGSDQVWNPYSAWVNENNFLTFISEEKRASIAASFSIDTIPEEKKWTYEKYLNGIPRITVREFSAQKIIKDLCGKDVSVIMDPTIVVDISFWESILEKPKMRLPKKYVVDYVLGDNTEKKIIKEFASKHNIEIVSLNKGSKWYITSPTEFLYIIKNAEFVFTDSYHGTIFSILFEIPFKNILRKDSNVSMQSRFETLYHSLGICSEYVSSQNNINMEFDYPNITKKVQEERKKSLKVIKKTILQL